jgi:phosphate uptake regulator
MFRALISMWRSKDLLSESFELFNSMLSQVERMFDVATDILLCRGVPAGAEEDLGRGEKAADEFETKIRRKMIDHLVLKGEDVPAALVLFEVVRDTERIADLCMDILSLSHLLDARCLSGEHARHIADLETLLEDMFSKTRRAFAASDEKLALEALALRQSVKTSCSLLLDAVRNDQALTVKDGISFALAGIYFQRVGAHLYHIAASVVSPSALFKHSEE